jgi:hypothetical protein
LLIDVKSRLRPLACVIAIAVGACVTPSIPVPPPDPQQMSFALDGTGGTATFAYSGDPNLGGDTVYVFNRRVGKGVIDTARVDGSIGPTDPFVAAAGDPIEVTFQQGDQAQSTCVLLKSGTPSSVCF